MQMKRYANSHIHPCFDKCKRASNRASPGTNLRILERRRQEHGGGDRVLQRDKLQRGTPIREKRKRRGRRKRLLEPGTSRTAVSRSERGRGRRRFAASVAGEAIGERENR